MRKRICVEPEAQPRAVLSGFHFAGTAREAPLTAYGTKQQRPKGMIGVSLGRR